MPGKENIFGDISQGSCNTLRYREHIFSNCKFLKYAKEVLNVKGDHWYPQNLLSPTCIPLQLSLLA
jgi:hypothetical protein